METVWLFETENAGGAMPKEQVEFYIAIVGLTGFVCMVLFSIWRFFIRHRSLRRREDGLYEWTEWHLRRRLSEEDPSQPGGEWASSGDGSSGDGGGE